MTFMYKYRSQHDSISFASRHRSQWMLLRTGLLDEKKVEDTSQFADKVEKTVDVWQYIATALENWTQRILDTESHHTTSENFRQAIEGSLRIQQLDGLLTAHDIAELRYVADLWTNLLNAIYCYTVGCVFVKRNIFTRIVFIETDYKLYIH